MKRATDPDILLLQATADPTRLAILHQLSERGGVCACDFTASCDVAQPTISHHLKVLRDAGWVTTERRGTWIWYSLCPDAVERFHQLAGAIVPGAARPVAMLAVPGRAAEPQSGCRPAPAESAS
jgi:ArsR family transcriptional regulator, arsenate/arsenite/antimonite-responsive transcriptional repressor